MSKIICVLIMNLFICEAAKILAIFPAPCFSHQAAFRPLTRILAKRGHEVTVITPLPANETSLENLKEISIDKSIREVLNQELADEIKNATNYVVLQKIPFLIIYRVFKGILENELKDFFERKETYDLIFIEACSRLNLLFTHVFKAPVIQISSFGGTFGTFEMVGAPNHPFLFPIAIRDKYKDLSMLEKMTVLYQQYLMLRDLSDTEVKEDILVKQYLGKDFPSLNELRRNIDIIFLNVHPMWDSNRPVPPNIVYLGSMNLQKGKELSMDLQILLNNTPKAIYMSFGSTVRASIFDFNKLKMFLNAASDMPYVFFLKWDSNLSLEVTPRNVIVQKWYPQADILRHPKIKLFITQGGLQSMDEAIAAGVPMLGIPLLWDQWYNVHKMVDLGLGLMCNIRSVDGNEFRRSVEEVIENDRYRENVEKYRKIINDQPQTPLEKAVWWTEYVIRHKGAKHLRSPAFEMSATDYYELNFILSVVAVTSGIFLALVLISYLTLLMFYYIYIYVTKVKKVKTE